MSAHHESAPTTAVAARSTGPPRGGRPRAGPPLILPAAAFGALFVASFCVLFTTQGQFPSPYDADADIQSFFAASGRGLQIAAVLQFGAAVPLAVLAAAVSARLHALGARAPGATIALVGGALASAFLTLSALLTWTLSREEVLASPPLVRALHNLAFLTGGPAHVVALGLLLAGIAVPALLLHLLPRWLAITGLILAVLAELSTLALVVEPAAVILPLTRFPALLWLIAAAIILPTSRHRTSPPSTPNPPSSADHSEASR